MRPLQDVKLVILDFDGTLASSIEGISACMSRALNECANRSPTLDEVRRTVGMTLEESIRTLTNFACPDSEIPAVVRAYRALQLPEAAPLIMLFDGVAATLVGFKDAGMKTVLVSNKGSPSLVQLLGQLNIAESFDLILGVDRVNHHKPSPA